MRSVMQLLTSTLFLIMGIGASAEETYLTATGEEVSSLEIFRDCDACPEMVVLPLGAFQMGSSVDEAIATGLRYFANRNLDTSRYEEELRQSFVNLDINPDDPEEGLRAYYAGGNIVRKEDPQYSVNPSLHEVPPHPVSIDLPIAMGRNEVTRQE